MITIPEDHVGTDTDQLAFPRISTCMSITLNVNNGPLIGTHLTIATSPAQIDTILDKMDELRGSSGIKEVLMAGVITSWTAPKEDKDENYLLPKLRDKLFSKFNVSRVALIGTTVSTSTNNNVLVTRDSSNVLKVKVWNHQQSELKMVSKIVAVEMKKRLWKCRDGFGDAPPTLTPANLISALSTDNWTNDTATYKTSHDLKI